MLCCNRLPWVDRLKHLRNTISNVLGGNQLDIKVKAAKNNYIIQEFYFAHHSTKLKVNTIYNTLFTESPLWNLGRRELEKLHSTYNKSIKILFELPPATQ